MRRPAVLVFDVNETLLDLSALDPLFARLVGEAGVRRAWFRTVIQYAWIGELLSDHRPFARYGAAALEAIARSRDVALPEDGPSELSDAMRTLPPHPEVPGQLERLRSAGFTLAALTNNDVDTVEAQFANAGIRGQFAAVLSADASGHLKPHRAVYESATRALGHAPDGLRMVAAHDWDLRGAMSAGMAGAFIARSGQTWNPLVERPDVWGRDLIEVADQLVHD